MSIEALQSYIKFSQARSSERLCVFVLAWHANEDGLAWPSQRTIAKEAGLRQSSVGAAIARAVERGELEIVQPGTSTRSTVYRLVVPSGAPGDVDNVVNIADVRSDLSGDAIGPEPVIQTRKEINNARAGQPPVGNSSCVSCHGSGVVYSGTAGCDMPCRCTWEPPAIADHVR